MKVLITCPPMLGLISEFRAMFESSGVSITTPKVTQTLTVEE
jgi:D-3-phosphoglycerate dehydrogenase